jgi:voltage-gated potassium channel Kch
MPSRQRANWTLVLRLTVGLTCIAGFVVLASCSALWLVERDRPNSTVRSLGDALWWSLSTMTTVGYGDHVPVTTAGRLIAATVMVVGVAVIGGVAAIVALAVALHIAIDEERGFEAEARNAGTAPRAAAGSYRSAAGRSRPTFDGRVASLNSVKKNNRSRKNS